MDYIDYIIDNFYKYFKVMQQTEILEQLLNLKEVSVFAVLAVVIWFLVSDRKSLKKDLKDKDNRIKEVIDSHQNDLKESNKDLQIMSEKWSVVFNQLKDIIKTKD